MQRNNTARSSCAPENPSTLPAGNTPVRTRDRLIALGQSTIEATKTAIVRHPKTAIVIAAAVAIGLIATVSRTAGTGLLFAGLLYLINQFIDSRMAEDER